MWTGDWSATCCCPSSTARKQAAKRCERVRRLRENVSRGFRPRRVGPFTEAVGDDGPFTADGEIDSGLYL